MQEISNNAVNPVPLRKRFFPKRIFRSSSQRLTSEQLTRFLSCSSCLFLLGWHDGANGPLLPYIQAHYHVKYNIVALLFVGYFAGSVAGTLLNVYMTKKWGIGKVLPVAGVIQAVGLALSAAKLPFPVMVVSYAFIGAGNTIQDATANSYTAGLPNVDFQLAILHTIYGLGAASSPLIATAFVTHGKTFNLFYVISVSISALVIAFSCYAFKFQHELAVEEMAGETELREQNAPFPSSTPVIETQEPQMNQAQPSRQHHVSLIKALKVYYVPIGALWFFLYVGAEVANGGWIVSYLLEERDGMTISRIVMVPVTRLLGNKLAVILYLGFALVFEFIIWFVKDLIAGAVAVSFVGFFFGPLYPVAISVITKLLPRSYHVASIGTIVAMSAVGSAFVPYIYVFHKTASSLARVGALAQTFSVGVLQPVEVIVIGLMLVIWFGIPKEDKIRRE